MGPGGNILAAIGLVVLGIFCLIVAWALIDMRRDGIKNLTLAGDTTVGGVILMILVAVGCGFLAVDQLKSRQVTIEQNDAAAVSFNKSVEAQGFTLVSTSSDAPPYSWVKVAIEGGCERKVYAPEWDGTKANLKVASPSGAWYTLTPALLQQQCHG